MDRRPIAFFDSGVGGFTVLRAALQVLPGQKYLYLADNARAPYGDLSPEVISDFTLEAFRFFIEMNAKAIIVACHTASVTCLPILQKEISVPVLGVTQGSLRSVCDLRQGSRIAVLGTTRTVQSGFYQKELQALGFQVLSVACPSLAPLIEEGVFGGVLLEERVRSDLSVLSGEKIDAVLFVCTHYPLIQDIIEKVLGPDILYVDGAQYTALQLSEMFLSDEKKSSSIEVYRTGSSKLFMRTAECILQRPLQCHVINIVDSAILPRGI